MGGEKKLAFDASRFSGWSMDPESIIIVGVDEEPNEATRHLLDVDSNAEPVDEATVKNMMVYGCVEPVIITKIGPDAYMVDGRGRGRALREANKRLVDEGKQPYMIPAIKRQDEEHKLFGVMVSANGFRREDSQLAKGEKVQAYLDLGRTMEEAEVTFGVSVTSLKNWLQLLELAAPVKKLIKEGKLSCHAASKLVNLPADQQIAKAKEAIAKAKATGKKATGKSMTKDTSGKIVPPGKRLVQKILRVEGVTESKVKVEPKPEHNNFFSALRYMLGELSAKDIGLDIKAVEGEIKRLKQAEKQYNTDVRKAQREEAKKAKEEQKAKEKADKKAKQAKGGNSKPTSVTNKPPQNGPTIAKKKGAKTAAA